jgi:hypothetical protein
MKFRVLNYVFLFCLFCSLHTVAQQIAPDPTPVGPLPTASGEYDLGAQVDNLVLPGCQPVPGYDCKVDVRAHVYYPQTLTGTYPVIIFLHGNHGTCGAPDPGLPGDPRNDDRADYTGTGTCPAGYIESPSYLGYDYMAFRLASYGYIVASIDANRGITAGPGLPGDDGLIKARGIMVLRHLQHLSTWNRHGGTPAGVGVELQGHLDFSNTGMMGHSRGGDGVRAAYNDYIMTGSIWPGMIEDPITFKGIFEIAPVDFLGNNSKDVAWNIIAGLCDGDVSDIVGIHPYDRDILPPFERNQTQKSSIMIWGANHNFFNSQWQISDASSLSPPYPADCIGAGQTPIFPVSPGSLQQRLTTMTSLMAFFRGNVGSGADPTFNRNFNPWWGIPATVTDETGMVQPYPTRADRGFTPPVPIKVFEDFTGQTGTSSYGFPNDASNITIVHGTVPNHDPSLRAGRISWTTAGPTTYFQTNWTAVGTGIFLTGYTTLELRISRQSSSLNPATPTDFSISLQTPLHATSGSVKLSRYTDPNFVGQSGNQSYLQGPVGSIDGGLHPILQTVRIPLRDFPGTAFALGTQVHGIRLTFDQTGSGAIYVANIRLSNQPVTHGPDQDTGAAIEQVQQGGAPALPQLISHIGMVTALRRLPAVPQLGGASGVEIEIASADIFTVRDAMLTLRIGDKYFTLSHYIGGDLHRVVFSLTDAEFASLSPADPIMVQYGVRTAGHVWNCGKLDKQAIAKK